MKGFLQFTALSSGVPTLFIKLAVFPGILWLRGSGHWWQSLEHGMSPNLHEDASHVGSKLWVNCFKLRPPFLGARIPVTTTEILNPQDPSLLRSIGIVSADLCRVNEIYGLTQGLGKCGLPLFGQRELETVAPEALQEGGVSHPLFQV